MAYRIGLLVEKYRPYLNELLYLVLSAGFLLALFQFLDYLHIPVYSVRNGIVVTSQFVLESNYYYLLTLFSLFASIYFINQKKYLPLMVVLFTGLTVFLLSGLVLSLILMCFLFFFLSVSSLNSSKILSKIFLLLSSLEVLSLVYWISRSMFVSPPFQYFANLEHQLFKISSLVSPLIVFFFLYMWLIKPLLSLFYGNHPFMVFNAPHTKRDLIYLTKPKHILFIIIVVSFLVSLYPYSPKINPRLSPTSPDVALLSGWLDLVDQDWRMAGQVTEGSRILFMFSLLFFKRVFNLTSFFAVLYFPVVLNPIFVYSVYFLAYKGLKDEGIALFSALFSVLSFPFTVGMYLYSLSNILFLSIIYFSIGFLFDFFDSNRYGSLIIASLLGVSSIFVHPWSLVQYFAALILLAVVEGVSAFRRKLVSPELRGLLVYIVVICLGDLLQEFLFQGYGGVSALASRLPELVWVKHLMADSFFAVMIAYKGLLSNALIFGLSVYALWFLDIQSRFHRFLFLLVFMSSIIFLPLDPYGKNRILCNLPYGVFVGLALSKILYQGWGREFVKYFLLFVFSSLGVYVFRSLFQLV